MNTNTIYCGDNLEVLTQLPEKSVDLIYADPPFFSNKHYEVIWNDGAEVRAFEDRWKGGIEHYTEWMEPRLAQCYRVLQDTGSMYLHCDWHANAYLRILMDKIFGASNFQNEIIWWYGGGGASKMRFARKHDNIYFYSKSSKWTFNVDAIREPYSEAWRGTPRADGSLRNFSKGKIPDDVYRLHGVLPMESEHIGYPTQKPEALLKRIIEASSNKGDIVLDPFCGCGTTLAVAQQLSRQWIGIDVSSTACRMMKDRLNKLGAVDIVLEGMPIVIDELKALKPFAFQDWVLHKIQGTPSNKKSGDMGIDGYTFMAREPVQVKQSEKVGRNVVDNFETAMRRENKTTGYIIAFSFTKGAHEEVARAKQDTEHSLNIKLVEIKEEGNLSL